MSGSKNHSSVAVVHILTIQGAYIYNETTIQCEAVFFDTSPSELSPEVVSLVQGMHQILIIQVLTYMNGSGTHVQHMHVPDFK